MSASTGPEGPRSGGGATAVRERAEESGPSAAAAPPDGSRAGAAAAGPRGAAVLEPGLDRPVGLVGARLWAAAAALLLVVGAGTGWAVFGTLPHTLALPAVLAHGTAPEIVRADRAGALLAYRVGPGARVVQGQPVALLRTPEGGEVEIPAPAAGTVTSLLSAPGAALAPGAGIVAVDASGQPPTLRLYATSLKDAGQLVPGRTVLVPWPGRGTLRATVTAVDALPTRADSLADGFPVPLPGLPTGSAAVWTAYARIAGAEALPVGPVPLTVSVDLGARHPYQAVLGTGAER